MILVDSSVWIDFFNGRPTPEADRLDTLLASEPLLIGDIILTEVLQGFRTDRDMSRARDLLGQLHYADMLGRDIALRAPRITACSGETASPYGRRSTS